MLSPRHEGIACSGHLGGVSSGAGPAESEAPTVHIAVHDSAQDKERSPRSAAGSSPLRQPVQRGSWTKERKGFEQMLARCKVVGHDLRKVGEAVEPLEQFYFLRADASEVHGLKDWSSAQWAEALASNLDQARDLVAELVPGRPQLEKPRSLSEWEEAASALRSQLSLPLTLAQWKLVLGFQNWVLNKGHHQEEEAQIYYMSSDLLSNCVFDREFPLGVEERVMRDKWRFAITHSGLRRVQHSTNSVISCLLYTFMIAAVVIFFGYLLTMMTGNPALWTLEATMQDPHPGHAAEIVRRGRLRGRVASLLNSMTFSLFVNASLDKFGLIDPSTSTVFVGMTLGGTWGFLVRPAGATTLDCHGTCPSLVLSRVRDRSPRLPPPIPSLLFGGQLDNLLGTDEGFREYLWSPSVGMRYAMGSLASAAFGRYIVTILFDMFFTVILFKHLYSKVVVLAGPRPTPTPAPHIQLPRSTPTPAPHPDSRAPHSTPAPHPNSRAPRCPRHTPVAPLHRCPSPMVHALTRSLSPPRRLHRGWA